MLGASKRPGYLAVSTEKGRCWMLQKDQVTWLFPQRRVGAGCIKKTRLPGCFHRKGLVLNEGCNKDQVIRPVPQRRVHARDSTKTRLYGLFHREGSMLKTRLPGCFHREGSMVCSTEKG